MYPKIDVNPFTLASLNLDAFDYPEPTVKTWSSLFGQGGSVTLEVVVDDRRLTLTSIDVERDGNVRRERDLLEGLAEEFIEDLHGNWNRLIGDSLERVEAHYAKQAAEAAAKAPEIADKIERFALKARATS